MKTPLECMSNVKRNICKEYKTAFFTVIILGLIAHLPVMIGDFPNHDGLASMYFDQNMITSGRWFLTIACGISSFFAIPWIIGLLSLIFLGIGAAALVSFLEIRETLEVIFVAGLLVSFPALCSTYAYIFTADGYMMALALALIAVALTKHYKKGFLAGGICLAFSMGAYQAYLSFAVLLCVYGCVMILLGQHTVKEKLLKMLRYLYMGIIGVSLYYLILQILLKIEGKVLDSYQGINGMLGGKSVSLTDMLLNIYRDFFAFTLKGNVLFNNKFGFVALAIITLTFLILFIRMSVQRRYVTKWYFYLILVAVVVFLPIATNVILIVSPSVTYHLLMRYQWILYPILMLVFIMRYGYTYAELSGQQKKGRLLIAGQWMIFAAVITLIVNYTVTDNIGYSNLQKKYEKTYAYCLRMVDRMEQTQGYYTGMPVAMIGVQNKEQLPETDLTNAVTGTMIGINGDYLIYTDNNYQSFFRNYLGVTINLVSDEEMKEIYNTAEYGELNSFPAENSMKVVNGILYIKTE